MGRLAAGLALLPALAFAGKKDPPVPLALAPLPGSLRCDVEELDKALRKDFAKSKRFTLVPEGTEGALRLEIADCARFEPRGRILPSGGGAAEQHPTSGLGSESPLGRGREPLPTVVLQVRLSGTRSMTLTRRSVAPSMSDAARGLKVQLEETLKTHAGWLAGGPAPPPAK